MRNIFGVSKPALYLDKYLDDKPYLRARIVSCVSDFFQVLRELDKIENDRVYFYVMHELSKEPRIQIPEDIITTVRNVIQTRWKIHLQKRKNLK